MGDAMHCKSNTQLLDVHVLHSYYFPTVFLQLIPAKPDGDRHSQVLNNFKVYRQTTIASDSAILLNVQPHPFAALFYLKCFLNKKRLKTQIKLPMQGFILVILSRDNREYYCYQ